MPTTTTITCTRTPMTDAEIRETLRQMLADWNAATPEQRIAAMEQARLGAELAELRAARS